jgi:hypothetical protein
VVALKKLGSVFENKKGSHNFDNKKVAITLETKKSWKQQKSAFEHVPTDALPCSRNDTKCSDFSSSSIDCKIWMAAVLFCHSNKNDEDFPV